MLVLCVQAMQVIFGSNTPLEFLTFIGQMPPTGHSPFQIDASIVPK